MSELVAQWPSLAAMLLLIFASALFSGSEAALFSLSPREKRTLKRAGLGGRLASHLLDNPERLLSAVLFWNLLINMIYFALAAMITGRLQGSESLRVAVTVVSLLTIIFFSEMVPKSVALLAPVRIATAVAGPLSIAVAIVSPILPAVRWANKAVTRLVWPGLKEEPEMELDDILRAVELSTDDAALLKRERGALQRLIELADVRVSEIMHVRNKWWVTESPLKRSVLAARPDGANYLLVQNVDDELVTHAIPVQKLRPSQFDSPIDFAEPVVYVPWAGRVAQVFDQLNEENRRVAIVVDEFGQWVGGITIEDILRNVLVPEINDVGDGEQLLIQEVGEGEYRVSGGLSIRALAKRLGVEYEGEGVTTVAGYIQRINERIPRLGDDAILDRYRLCVVEQDESELWIEVIRHDDSSIDPPSSQSSPVPSTPPTPPESTS